MKKQRRVIPSFVKCFVILSNFYIKYTYGNNEKNTLIRSLRYTGGRLNVELGKTEIQIDSNWLTIASFTL